MWFLASAATGGGSVELCRLPSTTACLGIVVEEADDDLVADLRKEHHPGRVGAVGPAEPRPHRRVGAEQRQLHLDRGAARPDPRSASPPCRPAARRTGRVSPAAPGSAPPRSVSHSGSSPSPASVVQLPVLDPVHHAADEAIAVEPRAEPGELEHGPELRLGAALEPHLPAQPGRARRGPSRLGDARRAGSRSAPRRSRSPMTAGAADRRQRRAREVAPAARRVAVLAVAMTVACVAGLHAGRLDRLQLAAGVHLGVEAEKVDAVGDLERRGGRNSPGP